MATNSTGQAGTGGTSQFGMGGPTPWWQSNPGAASNLGEQAPAGYKYDPVQMQYVRTPSSVGADQGAAINGLTGAISGNGYLDSLGLGASSTPTTGAPGAAPPQVGLGTSSLGSVSPYTPPATITPSGNAAQVAAIQGPDTSAAAAAAYAASKDQIGQASRGALTGLSGALAGRGIVGSGVEGRGISSVINGGQQQLADTSRALAQKQADLTEQNALASYQGDVTQRGQNIQNNQANTGFAVTQRGQDISAGDAAMNALLAQRGQSASLAAQEEQGGITQRGQDIGQTEFNQNYGLQQQDLALRKQAAALQGLQLFGGQALRGSTATY